MSLSSDQRRAAISLGADMAAARFARECRTVGLRWLLLKGPSIASRLYAGDELRPYVDLDVLVAPEDYSGAEAALARLGYREAPHLPRQRVEHASPWRAPRRVPIDLHRRIPHIPADPDLVWRVLVRGAERIRVAHEDVDVVGEPALALLIALHALHHGPSMPKPLKDLSLASERLSTATWEKARALAEQLGADSNLAAALTLTPGSKAVAISLGLPEPRSWEVALRSGDAARLATAIRLLRDTRGVRDKIAVLGRELVPEQELREKARGSGGSAIAVFSRRLWMSLIAAPRVLAAWRLERSDVRRFNRRAR